MKIPEVTFHMKPIPFHVIKINPHNVYFVHALNYVHAPLTSLERTWA